MTDPRETIIYKMVYSQGQLLKIVLTNAKY